MSGAIELTTADELLAISRDGLRRELIEGELIERSFAPFFCGFVAQNLAAALGKFTRENDRGAVVNAGTGFEVATNPDTVLAPDVGFVAKDRLPTDLSALVGFFPGAPNLAVEVVSPGDTYHEVETKVARYLDAGTRLVWVVRPKQKRVEVHRADGSSDLLSLGETLDGESVVPGFKLLVARIFGA